MNLKPLKTAGLVSLIMGILFAITGAVTWGIITAQLADERITTPNDAFLPGAPVNNPLAALAQADIINKHALAGSEGKTYAELGAEAGKARAAAEEAKKAGDQAKADEETAKAEEFTKQRTSVMNGSFLRASLFTSVLAYGVSLFAFGLGLTLIILGWALNKVGSQAVVTARDGATRA
ncbi:MAG: aromatic ring-opening dioxygenase LigA [Dermatophilus congolensis]|nr:aromatic ring-opening dioxygenase LigA [Dermatophilus congolensis]